jgi:hypothetical protein
VTGATAHRRALPDDREWPSDFQAFWHWFWTIMAGSMPG